jgi:hypothetical protein
MGRGLSDLQKEILRLAAIGRERRMTSNDRYDGHMYGCEVKNTEIRDSFYGSDLSEEEAKRANAAISRATLRLEERGLVVRVAAKHTRWAGVNLTD